MVKLPLRRKDAARGAKQSGTLFLHPWRNFPEINPHQFQSDARQRNRTVLCRINFEPAAVKISEKSSKIITYRGERTKKKKKKKKKKKIRA